MSLPFSSIYDDEFVVKAPAYFKPMTYQNTGFPEEKYPIDGFPGFSKFPKNASFPVNMSILKDNCITRKCDEINPNPIEQLISQIIGNINDIIDISVKNALKDDNNSVNEDSKLLSQIYSSDLNDPIVRRIIHLKKDIIDWDILSSKPLFLSFVDEFKEFLNFELISLNAAAMNIEILKKYEDKLNWTNLSKKMIVDQKLIDTYVDKIDFIALLENKLFTNILKNYVINNYPTKLNWTILSSEINKLELQFIRENIDNLTFTDEQLMEVFKTKCPPKRLEWVCHTDL